MKIVCDFCKTEYSCDAVPTMPVKCAVCGNTWTVQRPPRKNAFLVFIAATCALLAAIVFTVVIITRHQVENVANNPLVPAVTSVSTVVDASGTPHFVVNGYVQNRSDEIYGVPDLIIISWDGDGNIVAQQKFMPSATLLDAGGATSFTHTLSSPTAGVKKITAKLQNGGN